MIATLRFGRFELRTASRQLLADARPVALGARAFDVLQALIERRERLVTKGELLDLAWPGLVVEEANLQVQVSALRKILGSDAIATIPARGYQFTLGVTEESPTPAVTPKHNLPQQLTSFIGREKEIAEVQTLLGKTRLLTLTGSGGCGKTRLSLQVAAGLLDSYADGVWIVELAALINPDLVAQTVATDLGLKKEPNRSLTQTLTAHLESRHLLLLLDNVEHLLAACAELAGVLLPQCARVTMLATSREALGLAGELAFRVPSLSMPDPERDATPESLSKYESAQLFVERALFRMPHFAVTRENAPALASVCYRLDGIPLAIELAAARVRSMSLEELNQGLTHRFRLLTGGSRTALPRQQTLRSLIDWSYELLNGAEKALLCRVSVFSGGWALEAAVQVCAGEGIDEDAVLDLLTSLVDKSLMIAEERNGTTRYRLLETMRQYARDRLRESSEETRWQGQHLAYFVALAVEAEPQLTGADQLAWIDRLETEHDNLRSALAWSSAAGGNAAGGLRLAGALWRFWRMRGYPGEGRRWLLALLAAAPDGPTTTRAKALQGAGVLARFQGDYPAARALCKEGLAIYRKLGDRRGIADLLNNLGSVAGYQDDYAEARALLEEGLAIFRELGDRCGMASTLNHLGTFARNQGDYQAARALIEESLSIWKKRGDRRGEATALLGLGSISCFQGDFPAAQTLYDESLAIFHELGDRHNVAAILNSLGWMTRVQGDLPAAQTRHEECLAICRELGDRQSIANALNNLGYVACGQRDNATAQTLLKESLAIRWELADRWGTAWSLEGLAEVAFALGGLDRAARIWGRAERLREEIGAPLPPSERPGYERDVAAARAAMGDAAAFDWAWQEGRAMSMEQAIEYALEKT